MLRPDIASPATANAPIANAPIAGAIKRRRTAPPLLAALLLLAGCGVQTVALPYRPTVPPALPGTVPPLPALGVVAQDARFSADPAAQGPEPIAPGTTADTSLGQVRTGWHYRQVSVASQAPVAEVVEQAFAAGLAARGATPRPGLPPRYTMTVSVLQLNANRYQRIDSTVDLMVEVTAAPDGHSVWVDHVRAYNTEAGYVTLDTGPVVIAPTRVLGRIAAATLSEAVDRALDNPGLNRALQQDAAGPRRQLVEE